MLAMGVANVHATQGLDAAARLALSDVCHGAGDRTDGGAGDELPPLPATSPHCPFCHVAQAGIAPPPTVALSFPPPEPPGFFVPADDAGLQPSAPDSRHAPKHAPPSSFA